MIYKLKITFSKAFLTGQRRQNLFNRHVLLSSVWRWHYPKLWMLLLFNKLTLGP